MRVRLNAELSNIGFRKSISKPSQITRFKIIPIQRAQLSPVLSIFSRVLSARLFGRFGFQLAQIPPITVDRSTSEKVHFFPSRRDAVLGADHYVLESAGKETLFLCLRIFNFSR
jgi:hypothetical protein